MPSQKKQIYQMKKIDDKTGEIMIYGDIGEYWAEVTPKQFKKDLDSLGDVDSINLRVNSPGGGVTSGYAIYNQLKQHKAEVTAYIDGIAASMGAFIIMSADKILMSDVGLIMIHNPSGGCWGEAKDLRATAEVLDKMQETAIQVHAKRTKTSEEEIKEMMDKTTYLTAAEALELGFIDEIISYDDEDKTEIDLENKMLYIAGMQMNINNFDQPNLFLQKATNMIELGYMKLKDKSIIQKQEEREEKIMNLEEFKQKYPDIYKEAVQEGQIQERARMKAIDEVALPGTEEMVQKFKYDEPKSLSEATVEIVKSYKQSSTEDNQRTIEEQKTTPEEIMLQNMKSDSVDGNLGAVPGSQQKANKEEEQMQRSASLADLMNGGM